MEMNQPSKYRIHPLMAGAAVSVMLVSLLGMAAMTGVLPNSHASAAETARITAAETARMTAQAAAVAPVPAPVQKLATAPAIHNEVVTHRTVVHHRHPPVQQAQAQPSQQYSQAPAYQQPAPAPAPAPVAHNSPVGIGVGAVVGGLLGNQVGGGNGKTLATIAGAVGGGYVGNEIAKRYP
ncbi:glycine zipper 2TM domain-containing protein [Polaromonas sp.]|uniref:glycine zipper 2TM domain-containing protein n=1 Tax=Polaromonas sp. TaxID=1869339 RepID=UPI001803E0A2|nr:glycine zipper 2TM domain-containing protein [Polaromonas sp.]NML85487.1 glycine zipper 2TM domain-containing protein [Polaromonas sp.]